MSKILFWVAVIVGVMLLTRVLAQQAAKRQSKQDAPRTKPAKQGEPLGKPEDMVRCSHCDVYMPRSDAFLQNEQYWCDREHAKAGQKTRT